MEGKEWDGISEDAKDLIRRMLTVDLAKVKFISHRVTHIMTCHNLSFCCYYFSVSPQLRFCSIHLFSLLWMRT